MRNLLRSNYLTAFSTQDKAAENASGGIALWDAPELIQNAFNPLMFTRTKYLHVCEGYEPEIRKPNYITFSGTRINFAYTLTSSIHIAIEDVGGGFHEYTVGSGRDYWDCTGITAIAEILGVSFATIDIDDEMTDYISDENFFYVRKGFAYQDANFMCSVSGDVLYKNTEVESMELKIYKTDGSYEKLVAESFKGITKFDASAVVRKWLASELTDFPEGTDVMSEKALSVRYIVRQINGSTAYTYLAVNGVAQVGENPDRSADVSRILTKFSKLDLYDGYLLDYSIISGNTILHSARGVLRTLAVSRIRVDNAAVALLDESGTNIIQDEEGNDIEILPALDIPVFGHCMPQNPFYVRWINQLGGVDYFMFARQQKHQPSVKSVSIYSPFVENPLNARTNRKAYAMDTENVVTVGAENLNETDFNALRWLAFARKIERYDETLGKWITLSVNKFDGSYNTKADTHTVEVTFNLPKINTQF